MFVHAAEQARSDAATRPLHGAGSSTMFGNGSHTFTSLQKKAGVAGNRDTEHNVHKKKAPSGVGEAQTE